MQFIDLKTQQKLIRSDIDRRIAALLDHLAIDLQSFNYSISASYTFRKVEKRKRSVQMAEMSGQSYLEIILFTPLKVWVYLTYASLSDAWV